MAGTPEFPGKREVVENLLVQGTVFLHLDPRRQGVAVPEWLQQQIQIVLQIGLDTPIPIQDLKIDDEGIFATLSFNRSPYPCLAPWPSIFAIVSDDGRGMVWPEDMPIEIANEVEREARRRAIARQGAAESPRPEGGRSADCSERTSGCAADDAAAVRCCAPDEPSAERTSSRGPGDTTARPQRAAIRNGKRAREARPLPHYLRVVK